MALGACFGTLRVGAYVAFVFAMGALLLWERSKQGETSMQLGNGSLNNARKVVVESISALTTPPVQRLDADVVQNVRKPVFYLHLHNQAGTFMARAALVMGENVLKPYTSTLNFKTETCEAPVPCREKAKLAREQNATWTAVERSFNPDLELCTEDFTYVVTVKDPVAYFHTRLRHAARLNPEKMIDILRGKAQAVTNMDRHDRCWPPTFNEEDGLYPYFSNFLIRTFLGFNVWWSPVNAITREHLERAKKVALQFDVVLIADELPRHLAQLKAVLGWSKKRVRNVREQNHEERNTAVWSKQQLAFLQEHNKLDLEFFEFMKALAHAKTSACSHRTKL